MPAASEYMPDDKDQRATAHSALNAHGEMIKQHQEYYDNKRRPNLKDTQDHVLLGVVRQAIDRTVSFLVPDMPEISLIENETTDDETYLADTWKVNGGATLLSNIVLNGAKSGRSYVRVVESVGDMPARIINMNPSNITTFWHEDDVQKVLWHELHWTQKEKSSNGGMKDVMYRQDIVDAGNEWWMPVYKQEANKWKLVPELESTWAHPLPPIISTQHMPKANEFTGEHEFGHVGLSDSINYIASNINRIIRYHAHPKTIMIGVDATHLTQSDSVDGVWGITESNARVHNLEMQSDLQSSMMMLNELKSMYFSQSRVVVLSGGLEAFRGMTNLGIRSVFMDMISKNMTLRRQYGKLITDVCKTLLMLNGMAYDVEPTILWGEALPVDQREQLDLIQREINMGLLSKRTASKELGRDFDNEQDQLLEETLQTSINVDGFPIQGVSA